MKMRIVFWFGVVLLIASSSGENASKQNDPQCSTVNTILSLIPAKLLKLTREVPTKAAQVCLIGACKQPHGEGAIDIFCEFQCKMAGFSGGVCSSSKTEGFVHCNCAGNGDASAELGPLLCDVLGDCVCQNCINAAKPTSHYTRAICTDFHNGSIQFQCV